MLYYLLHLTIVTHSPSHTHSVLLRRLTCLWAVPSRPDCETFQLRSAAQPLRPDPPPSWAWWLAPLSCPDHTGPWSCCPMRILHCLQWAENSDDQRLGTSLTPPNPDVLWSADRTRPQQHVFTLNMNDRSGQERTVREGQAVAVPDRDVHHSGGGQLLYQFRTECCGLRGAAAEAGPAAPGIHLETSTLSRYLKKKVHVWSIQHPQKKCHTSFREEFTPKHKEVRNIHTNIHTYSQIRSSEPTVSLNRRTPATNTVWTTETWIDSVSRESKKRNGRNNAFVYN